MSFPCLPPCSMSSVPMTPLDMEFRESWHSVWCNGIIVWWCWLCVVSCFILQIESSHNYWLRKVYAYHCNIQTTVFEFTVKGISCFYFEKWMTGLLWLKVGNSTSSNGLNSLEALCVEISNGWIVLLGWKCALICLSWNCAMMYSLLVLVGKPKVGQQLIA